MVAENDATVMRLMVAASQDRHKSATKVVA